MRPELCAWVPSNNTDKSGRPAPLDGTNELVRQARGNALAAARRKRINEQHVARHVAQAMEDQGWVAPEGRSDVTLTFVEVSSRRDPDNIFGAAKYILDGLCTPVHTGRMGRRGKERIIHQDGCSAIIDDSQAYVDLHMGIAEPDRQRPGVWVRIREKEEKHEEV